jgi:hypothetical protein
MLRDARLSFIHSHCVNEAVALKARGQMHRLKCGSSSRRWYIGGMKPPGVNTLESVSIDIACVSQAFGVLNARVMKRLIK